MSGQWHYSQDGAQYGPVDEAEIIRLVQSGELPPGTPVLKEGSTNWKPLRNHTCFQVEIYPKKKTSAQVAATPTSKPASGGTSQTMEEDRPSTPGRTAVLGALVFFGGFAVMALEIVGARYLQPWFGSAFYVWVSQIGVVMMALAMGYAVGGKLADRWKHARYLGALLIPAAGFIFAIPAVAPGILDAIIDRHAQAAPEQVAAVGEKDIVETELLAGLDSDFLEGTGSDTNAPPPPPEPEDKGTAEIPAIWKKLDPAIGSAVVFLLPCFALAMISPYMIRIAAQQVSRIGTVSGLVYAASTVGSIGGVFMTAYVLIDHFPSDTIFYLTGGLTLGLAGLCFLIEWLWPETSQDE